MPACVHAVLGVAQASNDALLSGARRMRTANATPKCRALPAPKPRNTVHTHVPSPCLTYRTQALGLRQVPSWFWLAPRSSSRLVRASVARPSRRVLFLCDRGALPELGQDFQSLRRHMCQGCAKSALSNRRHRAISMTQAAAREQIERGIFRVAQNGNLLSSPVQPGGHVRTYGPRYACSEFANNGRCVK